jgi:hypothetical protein
MVWATPRRAPNSAYLELEHQPAINVEYTFILLTHRKYKTPKVMKNDWKVWAYNTHISSANVSPRIGAP